MPWCDIRAAWAPALPGGIAETATHLAGLSRYAFDHKSLGWRRPFLQAYGMTKAEATRLKNLIAKKAKFGDKFTKSDVTTLKNLQAKK